MEEILGALKTGGLNAVTGIPGQALNIGSQALSNYISMRQQRNQTDWYMENYGSPEARMTMMTEAGINGFTAAQGIAGSGGSGSSGPVQAPISSNAGTVTEAGAEATASELNTANADLVKSQKEAQDIQNEINEETKEEQKQIIKNNSVITASEAYMRKYDADHYKDFYDKNMIKLSYEVDLAYTTNQYYKSLDNKISYEIEVLSYTKANLEAQTTMFMSEADLADKNAQLAYVNTQIANKTLERLSVSVERYKKYGELPDWQVVYMELMDQGKVDEANEYINRHYNMVQAEEEQRVTGAVNAQSGHTGHVGQTIDAIRNLSGVDKNFNVNNILSSLGIYTDTSGRLQFTPIVSLCNWFERKFGSIPTYEQWSKDLNTKFDEQKTILNNDLKAGKITKSEWSAAMNELTDLRKDINRDYYDANIRR